MGRTINPDALDHSHSHPSKSSSSRRGGSGRNNSSQSRTVQISKALSKLLRHQAENFGVPITADGWVRLDHVLAWKGLGSGVKVEEIWGVVEENEKKRFAVRLVDGGVDGMGGKEVEGQPSATVDEILGENSMGEVDVEATGTQEEKQPNNINTTTDTPTTSQDPTKNDSETALAISYFRNTSPTPPASEFMIRATQGHSIKTITSDTGLMTPITLSSPSSIPATCVHGTFYGSWTAILASGGLKRMGRNHVHFAEGPGLSELGLDENGEKDGNMEATTGERKEVISGMRRDAQLLVYADVKAALEGEGENGMTWWRSENGVVLTEGVEIEREVDETSTIPNDDTVADPDTQDTASASASAPASVPTKRQGKSKNAQTAAQSDKMVSMKYWTVVVDVKGGRGAIWRQGEGVVRELPEDLMRMGTPKGRGRGGGSRGGTRGGSRGRGR